MNFFSESLVPSRPEPSTVAAGFRTRYRSMDARRRQALFGIMVALKAEGSDKISALSALEDETAEEGDDGFHSVRMRVC